MIFVIINDDTSVGNIGTHVPDLDVKIPFNNTLDASSCRAFVGDGRLVVAAAIVYSWISQFTSGVKLQTQSVNIRTQHWRFIFIK